MYINSHHVAPPLAEAVGGGFCPKPLIHTSKFVARTCPLCEQMTTAICKLRPGSQLGPIGPRGCVT